MHFLILITNVIVSIGCLIPSAVKYHSEPNCETRKWMVLGESHVGIFAKRDIPCGTELAYDYKFEWYGGAKVRCLCGAPSCFGFLGAKSRGFQVNSWSINGSV